MDIPDHILEELEYLEDCITSCNKVENFLMMSEYENNLGKTRDHPLLDKRLRRKWISNKYSITSMATETNFNNDNSVIKEAAEVHDAPKDSPSSLSNKNGHAQMISKENNPDSSQSQLVTNARTISVIEEVST